MTERARPNTISRRPRWHVQPRQWRWSDAAQPRNVTDWSSNGPILRPARRRATTFGIDAISADKVPSHRREDAGSRRNPPALWPAKGSGDVSGFAHQRIVEDGHRSGAGRDIVERHIGQRHIAVPPAVPRPFRWIDREDRRKADHLVGSASEASRACPCQLTRRRGTRRRVSAPADLRSDGISAPGFPPRRHPAPYPSGYQPARSPTR